jgi:hypothetical protein
MAAVVTKTLAYIETVKRRVAAARMACKNPVVDIGIGAQMVKFEKRGSVLR